MHHSYFVLGLTLPGDDRDAARGDRGGGMVLMLHELQRAAAPSCINVSISTAVWIVMCRQPTTRAPASRRAAPNSSRDAISPGISVSAIAISRRPQSASETSAADEVKTCPLHE